jgi:hypothetical protein
MVLIQAALIGLVALILTPGALLLRRHPKLVVLLLGAAALFGAFSAIHQRFSLLLLLSLASAALSTAISSRPALSLFGSTWRRYGLVAHAAVLLVAWFVHQTRDRGTIVRGLAMAGAVSAIYGIAQYFGYDPILPAAGYHIGEGIWTIVRPPGTLGYVSYFATWLLMCGFLGLSAGGRLGCLDSALLDRDAADRDTRGFPGTGRGTSALALAAGLPAFATYDSRRRARRGGPRGILLVSRRLESARPDALVRGGPLGRRAPAALAR